MLIRDIVKSGKQTISLKKPEKEPGERKKARISMQQKKSEPQPKQNRQLLIAEQENTATNKRAANLAVVAAAACIILLFITAVNLGTSGLRFKRSMIENASAGFEKIVHGAKALSESDFENAKTLFTDAEQTFNAIRTKTWFISPKISTLTLKDPVIETANAMIAAGDYLSNAGSHFTEAAKELRMLPQLFFDANKTRRIIPQKFPSLTEKLKKQLPIISAAVESLKKAHSEIKKVPATFIPAQLRERFAFAKSALSELSAFLTTLNEDIPAILALLGDKEPHAFLVLLQNNAELRPSGGFIGNVVILETNDGYLTKNEVFDVYQFDHELKEILTPPAEILPVNPQWFLRDSNYSGHFPLSAAKAAWFLEKENGPGVDTVLAIDQSFIAELLRLTGPIKIPELNQPLSSENFSAILSYIVESKITGRQEPKAILKSFIPAFQKAVFDRVDAFSLLPLFRAAISSKHLLAYSKDPLIQEFLSRHEITGAMKTLEQKEDYLNIVHTSIGGNKSDAFITENISHDTYLKSDGSVIDEVTITRKHGFYGEVENRLKSIVNSFGFSQISDHVMQILGRSRNLHMLRIYVPAGAILEKTSDDTVTTNFDAETGKTYFRATMNTPVGDARTLVIRYRLPFKLNLDPVDKYSLTVQKQAGQNNTTLQKRVFPDSRVLNYKYFPENGSIDLDGVLNHEIALEKDTDFSSIWGK